MRFQKPGILLESAKNKNTHIIKKNTEHESAHRLDETGRVKIWMKLIGVFLLPVCFIILLGVISFNKASTALINNYKASTLSNLNSMASYLDLGFDMVSDKATLLNTNSILKNYYSGNYKDKQLEEMKKYKELQEFAYANILSDNIIKNIYIFGSYGNAILTKGTSSASLYSDFMNSEDGLSFLNSGESKKWIGSHPYLDSVAGITDQDYSVSLISYIYNDHGEKPGYILLDVSMDFVRNSLSGSGLPSESKIAFLMRDGKEISEHSTSEADFFTDTDFCKALLSENAEDSSYELVDVNGVSHLFFYSYVRLCDGYLCVLLPQSYITKQADSVKIITVIIVLLASLIAILLGTVMAYGISNSIKKIILILEAAASGDLSGEINIKRKDEFLLLASGINRLVLSLKGLINDMAAVSKTVHVSATDVSSNSSVLLQTTQSINSVADEVIQGVQSQCEGTESSLTEMSELSQQIERLCESTELIRKSAYNTTEITKKGMIIIDELELKTKKSSAIINSVIENIEELEHKSNAISGILKSINEIAAQTNLLSLNATIEAARSGIEGLGFQVVANEIKHLAEKSAQEAKRIGSIIAEIQDQTQITVKNAKNAQEEEAERVAALKGAVLVFSDIDNNVKMLSSNLDHIMTSINEIENAKEDTLAAFEEISAISQQTTAAMDQFRDTASRQLEAVESLNKAVEELGIDSNLLEKKISVFRTDS